MASSVTRARVVTSFGTAALSQYMVGFLRKRGAGECTVLASLPARVREVRWFLQSEGLGEVKVDSFCTFAHSLGGYSSPGPLSRAGRFMLFCGALARSGMQAAFADALEGETAGELFNTIEALRANRVRSHHLEPLRGRHPGAGMLYELLEGYEQFCRERNIPDIADMIEAAGERVKADPARFGGGCYVLDSFHEARPDEFELALALGRTGAQTLFLYDPSAPPPGQRDVVRGVESELARRLGAVAGEAAPPSPSEELGKKIAAGNLDSLGERATLLLFNDLASQQRGLARKAQDFAREGIAPQEMSFFADSRDSRGALLRYELQHAGLIPAGEIPLHCGSPVFNEAFLALWLFADPERQDLRARAIAHGMAGDEKELQEKLSALEELREPAGLDVLAGKIIESLLPGPGDLKAEVAGVFQDAARDFALFAPAPPDAELTRFLYCLPGYLEELACVTGERPPFIGPGYLPSKRYAVVFLPSLVLAARPARPGVFSRQIVEEVEQQLGRPLYLNISGDERRRRWELGAAAACAERVVLSLYRLEKGRLAEPVPWLRAVLAGAQGEGSSAALLTQRSNVRAAGAQATLPTAVAVEPELSVSRLTDYNECPYRFYLQHVLKIRPPRPEQAARGALVHTVLAKFHQMQETDFSLGRMISILDEEAREFELDGESLAQVRELLSAYAREHAPHAGKTIAVEKNFKVSFGGATVRGRIDRIAEVPGGVKLVDYKTSGKGKEQKHKNAVTKRLEDLQLPLYTLGAREAGFTVRQFSYVYLNYDKTHRPHEVVLQLREGGGKDALSEAGLGESLGRIGSLIAEIIGGPVDFPKGEKAICDRQPSYCPFAHTCIYSGA